MSSRLLETKHEISYLKSRVELASSNSIIATNQRYTFVFNPAAVAPLAPNVFTVWADLLTAIALVSGPILIEFVGGTGGSALTVPGGDLGGHQDIWFVAKPVHSTTTQINVTQPFTNGYPTRITNLSFIYTNALAPCFNLPELVSATGQNPTFFIDGLTQLQSTGEVIFQCTGAVNSNTAFFLIKDFAFAAGPNEVFGCDGAASTIAFRMYDSSGISNDQIRQVNAGTVDVLILSPSVTFSTTQTAATGGVVYPAFSYPSAADVNRVYSNSAFVTSLTPAAQTNPVNATDIMVAQITPRMSGFLMASVNLQWQGTPGDTITFTVNFRLTTNINPALGNATASNTNCYFATADGSITYGGGVSSTVVQASPISYDVPLAGPALFNFSWSGIVNFGTAQLNNARQFLVLTVQRTAGAGGIGGQSGLANPMTGQMSVYELSV